MLFYLWSLNGSTGKNAKTLSSGCGLYSSRLIFFLSRVQPVAGDKLMPCVCIHSMPYWAITRGWLGHLNNSGVGRDRHAPNASETCDRLFSKTARPRTFFPRPDWSVGYYTQNVSLLLQLHQFLQVSKGMSVLSAAVGIRHGWTFFCVQIESNTLSTIHPQPLLPYRYNSLKYMSLLQCYAATDYIA